MATKEVTKKKGIPNLVNWVALVWLLGLGYLLLKGYLGKTKYAVNEQLTYTGTEGIFTIYGVWEVNKVLSYIMESPSVPELIAYPVKDVDADPNWSRVV
jgi:hypothetical protein